MRVYQSEIQFDCKDMFARVSLIQFSKKEGKFR